MKRKFTIQSRKNRRGTALVEFAFVFPVFLSVIFFFFETWRFQQFQQTVDQAVLDTARAAITPGANVDDSVTRGRQLLQSMGGSSATLSVSPDPIEETTDQVTVTGTLPCGDVGLFFQYFASGYVFTSTITLDTENSRVKRIGLGN